MCVCVCPSVCLSVNKNTRVVYIADKFACVRQAFVRLSNKNALRVCTLSSSHIDVDSIQNKACHGIHFHTQMKIRRDS